MDSLLEALIATDVNFMLVKITVLILILLHVPAVMLWVERRGSALMQNRSGPNRIGPLGLLQALADAIKFIFKEDRVPGHVNRFYYILAPALSVIPAFMTFAVVPLADKLVLPSGRVLNFQVAPLDVGMLYIFAIASLGVYGIIIAGWSSNSKYALFGSLRSSAQMISYELSMTLSVAGLLMIFSSLQLNDIALGQGESLLQLGPLTLPRWGIFLQPLGFLIFLTTTFAETNRLPFDMPEGESEIVAGYHLEYGGLKFALFFLAEYVNMLTASALLATLFLGGWQMFFPLPWILNSFGLSGLQYEWARVGFQVLSLFLKIGFFMWFFVWVRWTLPRFRYDQVMSIGWKVLLPLACVNIFVTAGLVYYGVL